MKRLWGIALACALMVLVVLPAAASAQATRTWVSGVGDDANPCSRTAPCKTFAGAISKTAAKGEINCLDPAGFGAVTIVKAMTIDCRHTLGGVLVSSTNGIIVQAGVNDVVSLRGLDINGLDTGQTGIKINSAKRVRISDSQIYGFSTAGIGNTSSSVNARTIIDNVTVDGAAGAGVLLAPTGGNNRLTLRNSTIVGSNCGVLVASAGLGAGICGPGAFTGSASAVANLFNNSISDNGFGVLSNGTTALVRISNNDITGNTTGISAISPSSPTGGIFSFGNNSIDGNGTNGSPTGILPKT